MRFITGFTSFLFASVALASPIARPEVAERQLCQIGMPCFMQKEVDNAVTFANQALVAMNNAVSILMGPATAIVADVTLAGNALVTIGGQLASDASQMSVEMRAQLKSQVNAAIAMAVASARADVDIIAKGAPTMQADLQAGLDVVTNAIIAIEAVIGPCVSPS